MRAVDALFLSLEREHALRVLTAKSRRWPVIAKRAAARLFAPSDGGEKDVVAGVEEDAEQIATAADRARYGDRLVDYGRSFGYRELQRHGTGIGRLGLDGRFLTPSELKALVASPLSVERVPPFVARFLERAAEEGHALVVLHGHLAEAVASELLDPGR